MADLIVQLECSAELETILQGTGDVTIDVDTQPVIITHNESYKGDYSVTPSNEQQVIQVKDKTMADNFIVEAIPNNYGLITYNGATITVS